MPKTSTTKRFVALLRGINVGGNCRVEMKRLKSLCEKLGYADVLTYINSGNVLFSSSKSASTILRELETALKKEFGFHIPTILRSQHELTAIATAIPEKWTNDKQLRTDVLFLWDAVDAPSSLNDIVHDPKVDILRYIPGAIVWHLDRKYLAKSGMHKFIGTKLYKQMTARNINTVRKLVALMQKAD
jgi:uncharacterized protein (DUF1697 family)